jgi:hypothetical protein
VGGIHLYNQIKKKIDIILKSKSSNQQTYSICLLSLIKTHPFYIKNYKSFNYKKKFLFFQIYLKEIYSFFKFFHFFFDKQIEFKKIKISKIFVSHFMNKFQKLDKDPNFVIPKKSLGVYLNHTYSRNIVNRNNNCIILARRLRIREEFRIIINQFKERKKLLDKYKKQKDYFIRLIAADAISPSTISNNRIALQVNQLIKHYKPKKLITTFEGYSWEKVIVYYANKKITNCKTYGYIPGLLLKNYGSNIIKYKSDFYPKKILVSGKYTEMKLKKLNYLKNKVANLGSIKNFPLKYKLNNKNKSDILVIPEGIFSELDIFLKFIETSIGNIDNKFIIRLHPVMKNNKKYIDLIKKVPNIILSQKSLQNDIERSKFVLYRGSNLVVNCIKNGLIPLYLNFDHSKINIDPIYDMKNFTINNILDLKKLLKVKQLKNKITKKRNFFSKYKSKFFH